MRPGCDAQVAVWVAPEFGYEHAQALHRLNEWTKENIRFFGVKVEVIKEAGGECLEARFRKVVYPGGWNKEATLKSGEMPATKRQYYEFFQPLITKLRGEGFADQAFNYFGHTGRLFPSQFDQETGYAVSFWKELAHGYLSTLERGTALSLTIGYSTSWRPNGKMSNRASMPALTRTGSGTDTTRSPSPP